MKTYQKIIAYSALVAGSLGLLNGCKYGSNSVVTGNFDRDNFRDVARSDVFGNIYVRWNNKGQFDEQKIGTVINGCTSIAAGDMNNDGLLDIVAVNYGRFLNTEVHILYNQGDRSFRMEDND